MLCDWLEKIVHFFQAIREKQHQNQSCAPCSHAIFNALSRLLVIASYWFIALFVSVVFGLGFTALKPALV